jgi:hypothetical protein
MGLWGDPNEGAETEFFPIGTGRGEEEEGGEEAEGRQGGRGPGYGVGTGREEEGEVVVEEEVVVQAMCGPVY